MNYNFVGKVKRKEHLNTDLSLKQDILEFGTVPSAQDLVEIKFNNEETKHQDVICVFRVALRLFYNMLDKKRAWDIKLVLYSIEDKPLYQTLFLDCKLSFGMRYGDDIIEQNTVSIKYNNKEDVASFCAMPNSDEDYFCVDSESTDTYVYKRTIYDTVSKRRIVEATPGGTINQVLS